MASTLETFLPQGFRLLSAFRCGQMKFDGKLLTADPRKGWLLAAKSDDGLLHVQWVERNADNTISAQQPELDTIVFPSEATFKRAGNPAQRVFMLRFPEQSDRNMFFWMQEPSADGDEELANQMQAAINGELGSDDGDDEAAAADALGRLISSSATERGHTSMAQGAGTVVPGGSSIGIMPQAPGQKPQGASMASQLAAMLSGMSQQQAAPSNSAGGPPSRNDMASALAAALAQAMAGHPGQQQQQQQQRVAIGPSLHEVLKPEALEPFLKGPQVLQSLAPFLPEQHRTPEALAAVFRSSQFQQQLHTFSMALQTGQLDLQQFGLRAQGFTAADFLSAIQDLVDRERAAGSGAQQDIASAQGPDKSAGGRDAMQE